MDNLEKYYNERIRTGNMKKFIHLSVKDIELLGGTLGYQIWVFSKAVDEMRASIKQNLNKMLFFKK